MDDFFLRIMQICCRFLENDKPSNHEILGWFSYLVYIPKDCDEDDQIISHSQDLDLIIKDKGYMVFNQH
jgi:hypothetical protein